MNAGPADGTPLARSVSVSQPDLDAHILPRARAWFRRSFWPTLAFLALVVALLAAGGLSWKRVLGVAGTFVALTFAQIVVLRTARTPEDVQSRTTWTLLHGLAAQAMVLCLTGGPASPLVLWLAAPIGGAALLLRRERDRVVVWAAVAVVFAAIALAPTSWLAVPPLAPAAFVTLQFVALVGACFSVHEANALHREVQEELRCCLDAMQEERVVEAKEQLRRLQSVGAKVAHELKNPLASIKGLVQLVERSVEEPRAKERLAVVSTEIQRMETILRDYLSYSRPLEDLHPGEVELVALATDVRSVLAGRAEHARVTVACRGEPLVIQGDPRRLKEALINLVANAIEATQPGGTVDIAVEREPDHARITIRDSGSGMTPEHLTRVGQSFFTTRSGGTGLGVVLARNAIVQHGGGLRFASKPGAGTTVTVELPLRPAEPAGSSASPPSAA